MLTQERRAEIAASNLGGLKDIAAFSLRELMLRLRAHHGDKLEEITDEWIKSLDEKIDFPGPDEICVRVLDWALPEKVLDFLDFAVEKLDK